MARVQTGTIEITLSMEEWKAIEALINFVEWHDLSADDTIAAQEEYDLWARADDILHEVNGMFEVEGS